MSWKTWKGHGRSHGIWRAQKSTNPGNRHQTVPRWQVFLKKKKKAGLKKRRKRVMSYIIQRMPCKWRYRISIVYAFSCGWAKTIGIRVCFRKRKKKFSGFKNIGIRVEMALMKTTIFFCNFIFVFQFTRNVQYIQLIWLTWGSDFLQMRGRRGNLLRGLWGQIMSFDYILRCVIFVVKFFLTWV